jgi:hypothetical protein
MAINADARLAHIAEYLIRRSPTVFISYSHESEAHKKRVLALTDRLRKDGVDAAYKSKA